jgi:hypothetical protein
MARYDQNLSSVMMITTGTTAVAATVNFED